MIPSIEGTKTGWGWCSECDRPVLAVTHDRAHTVLMAHAQPATDDANVADMRREYEATHDLHGTPPVRVNLDDQCLTVGDLIRTLRLTDPWLPIFVQAEDLSITKPLTRVVGIEGETAGKLCGVVLMIKRDAK